MEGGVWCESFGREVWGIVRIRLTLNNDGGLFFSEDVRCLGSEVLIIVRLSGKYHSNSMPSRLKHRTPCPLPSPPSPSPLQPSTATPPHPTQSQ